MLGTITLAPAYAFVAWSLKHRHNFCTAGGMYVQPRGKKLVEFHVYGNGMQSNTAVSLKVYLMVMLDNYVFRPILAIFRLS